MWSYPVLSRLNAMMGRAPNFINTKTEEVISVEQVVVDPVNLEPEIVGNATTGSGVVGTIWHYPGESVYKYGAMFPTGFEVWNKPKQFRTYDDAEWFITDVISPARTGS